MIKTSNGQLVDKAEMCNYCGRVVSLKEIKAMKNVDNIAVKKIKICRKCWSDNDARKMFKNNKVKYLSVKLF